MGEWSCSTELPALAVAWWKWITPWKLTFRIIPISPKSLSGFQAGFSWNVWCHGMWLNQTWLVNFGGRIGCRGQSEKKKIMNHVIILFAIAVAFLHVFVSHVYHIWIDPCILSGLCWNGLEVLDHEVYLQGAPSGRDLIHWDRQLFDGFLVRLLTVLAAWVWGS